MLFSYSAKRAFKDFIVNNKLDCKTINNNSNFISVSQHLAFKR